MHSLKSTLLTRFAPTPSGFLHEGNVFSLVLIWLLAKKMDSRILLRIDDMDRARCRKEFVTNIFQTIDFMGLDYDLGPQSPEDFERHFSQRNRMDRYHEYFQMLLKNAKESILAYPYTCSCSRKDLQSPEGIRKHERHCLKPSHEISYEKGMATRLRVHEDKKPELSLLLWPETKVTVPFPGGLNDTILWKKDGWPAYQICSLVDDAHFGVNWIIRGVDLWDSSLFQSFLKQQFFKDLDFKPQFLHHPLIKNASGLKLSKSQAAPSIVSGGEKGKRLFFQRFSLSLGMEPMESKEEILRAFTLQHAEGLLQKRNLVW